MPQLQDCRGVPHTAANQDALDAYDRVIKAYMGFRVDIGDRLKEALTADADMPMAHVLRGYLFQLMGLKPLNERAKKTAEHARGLTAGGNEREQLHAAVLNCWANGDTKGATVILEQILLDHPLDLLAIRTAHYMHFYSGDTIAHRDSISRIMPAWDEEVPGYSYLMGMRAFSLEEAGHYDEAETAGRVAVDLDHTDTWAIHAVTHVMETLGRQQEGIAWVNRHVDEWDGVVHQFANHLWWHLALFQLALGQHDEVLDLYDNRIWAAPSEDGLDISNATSMLMRLSFRGLDVGHRWQDLAEQVSGRLDEHLLPFNDTHFMMPLAMQHDEPSATGYLASMRQYVDTNDNSISEVMGDVSVNLAEAIWAFGQTDYDRTVAFMLPIRYRLHGIGGSHAQRDVFHTMLAVAALRAERTALARALWAERIDRQKNCAWSWRCYADALGAAGHYKAADQARERATAIALA